MKDECSMDVVKLNHREPENFSQFVWEFDKRPSLAFVVFERWLHYSFSVYSGFVALLLTDDKDYWKHFDFWTSVLISSTFVLPLSHIRSYGDGEYRDSLPWYNRLNWIAHSTALPAGIVGMISYWALVYKHNQHTTRIFLNIVPVASMVIGSLVCCIPLRLLHFAFFVMFYTSYIIFTMAYQLGAKGEEAETKYIYEKLNWKEPGIASVTTFVGLMIGLVTYVIFYAISVAKFVLRERYYY